jgi:Fe-S cluster biogenesis protein NfuA
LLPTFGMTTTPHQARAGATQASCQLDALSREVAREAPLSTRLAVAKRTASRAIRKLRVLASQAEDLVQLPRPEDLLPASTPPLGLQPGERVRVRSLEEIHATLNAHGACEGCYFVQASMGEYCDQTFTVLRRVETFYDERERRLCKTKNTVLLDGVHCRGVPAAGFDEDWKGCDRMCLLFWKEAWLERLTPRA